MITQPAWARLRSGRGFFCRSVLPSSVGLSALRVSISGSLNTVDAGSPCLPSRSCTNWISIHAAFVATAANLTNRSADASWLSSICSPCACPCEGGGLHHPELLPDCPSGLVPGSPWATEHAREG